MKTLPKHIKLVLFDGICNLCNSSVLYIIKHDKKNLFMFAPLQSKIGAQLIKEYHIDTNEVDSIMLYEPKKGMSFRSTAALKIIYHLSFPTNLLVVFYIIPPFIRNWLYNFIAKRRYKWFGKKETCMVPTPELQNKFIP